jgi:hypothetical protein
MYIRVKDGRYAGEIREFLPHIAKDLIAKGRASNPFNEIEDPPEERVEAQPKPAKTQNGRRNR